MGVGWLGCLGLPGMSSKSQPHCSFSRQPTGSFSNVKLSTYCVPALSWSWGLQR